MDGCIHPLGLSEDFIGKIHPPPFQDIAFDALQDDEVALQPSEPVSLTAPEPTQPTAATAEDLEAVSQMETEEAEASSPEEIDQRVQELLSQRSADMETNMRRQFESELAGTAPVPAQPVLAPAPGEPIAIVGIGCRFPGGSDGPERFVNMTSQSLRDAKGMPTGADLNADGVTDNSANATTDVTCAPADTPASTRRLRSPPWLGARTRAIGSVQAMSEYASGADKR